MRTCGASTMNYSFGFNVLSNMALCQLQCNKGPRTACSIPIAKVDDIIKGIVHVEKAKISEKLKRRVKERSE